MITEIDDYLDAVVRECKKHGDCYPVSAEELGLPISWDLRLKFDREGDTPVLLFFERDPEDDDNWYISAKATYPIPAVPKGAVIETCWYDGRYDDCYVDPEDPENVYGPVSELEEDISEDPFKWPIDDEYYVLQGEEDAYSPMFHYVAGSEKLVCAEIDEDAAVRFVAWLLKL